MQNNFTFNTIRLFDEDQYMSQFTARVISCTDLGNGTFSVILDTTAFFPEGGGQPSDTGKLTAGGVTVNVIHVKEEQGTICHITDAPVEAENVGGEVDFPKRYERMRNHSGEHLLSGAAHRLYGCTNVGFHLNDSEVTVDLDRQLTREELMTIEEKVNAVIAENVPITTSYPPPELLGDLDYRSKLDLTENVRIVEIGEGGEYDRCACCAPHVASTGEIGMLIITDHMNYKGGTRLTMVCGMNAYKTARMAMTNVKDIASRLSAKMPEASAAVVRLMGQLDEEKGRAAALCNRYIDMRLASITPTDGDLIFFEPSLDRNALRRFIDKAADFCGGRCAGFSGSDETGWTYIIISRTHDLKAESKSFNEKMNGRGGGSPQMIQGTANAPKAVLEKLFD